MVAQELIDQLQTIFDGLPPPVTAEDTDDDSSDDADGDDRNALGHEELLEFLFSKG